MTCLQPHTEAQTSQRTLGSPTLEKLQSLRNMSQYIPWLTIHYHTKTKAVISLVQVLKKCGHMQHIQTLIETYAAVIPGLSVSQEYKVQKLFILKK